MVRYDKEEINFVYFVIDICILIVYEIMGFCYGFEKYYYVFCCNENKKKWM